MGKLRTRAIWPATLAATLIALAAAPAQAAPARGHAAPTPIRFNPSAGELPEGITLDHHGDIFVSLGPLGVIREVAADGTQSTIATVAPAGKGLGPLGLARDGRGDIFAAVATFDPATTGVFEVSTRGAVTRLPGSGNIGLPNGLAFDDRGSLYVTDSLQGAVWRLSSNAPATKFVQDPLLAGDGSFGFGFPIGANGIAYRHGSLYVAATEAGRIVRIPIAHNGTAGTLQVVDEGSQLIGADGCQFDAHGNLYIALNVQNKLVRLSPSGALTVLATAADGLDFPASPLFGLGHGDRTTVFLTNLAVGHSSPADAHPSVLAFQVGVPGQPLPTGGAF
jgi:sugar lactone lactonase YvrE